MEIVEKHCENCGEPIYIQEEYIREKMFCTLGCMGQYQKSNSHKR
jgi:formylmethanofuran dehydrogenase subunit E